MADPQREDTEPEIDVHRLRKPKREDRLDALVKRLTSTKAVIAYGALAASFGVAGRDLWQGKANAADVVLLSQRMTAVEVHHAADDAELQAMHASQTWMQDTLFKLSQKANVPDVAPTPVTTPTPPLPVPKPTP